MIWLKKFNVLKKGGHNVTKHVGEGMYLPTKKMQLALSTSPALIEHGFDVETVDLLDDFKMLLDSDSMDEFEIRKIISNREKREAGVL